jgi:hypothetical protein
MSDAFWARSSRGLRAAWNPLDRETSRVPRCQIYGRMALVLPFVLAACATTPPIDARSFDQPSRDLALHIIEVDPDGEGDELDPSDLPPLEPADAELCPEAEKVNKVSNDDAMVLREKFKCVIKTAIEKHKRSNKKPWPCGVEGQPLCLTFHFNGGRNSKGDAIHSAEASYQQIENARMYPIYMVWPTGDLESYGEDLLRVRTGRLTKPYDPATFASIPGRFPSDLLRGLASTPAAWATSLFEFYHTGFGFGSERYMLKRDTNLHVSAGERIRACEGPAQRDCKTFTIDADRICTSAPRPTSGSRMEPRP